MDFLLSLKDLHPLRPIYFCRPSFQWLIGDCFTSRVPSQPEKVLLVSTCPLELRQQSEFGQDPTGIWRNVYAGAHS